MTFNTDAHGVPQIPLYEGKPRRAIPGTGVTAVTMEASADRGYRRYRLFHSEHGPLSAVTYSNATRTTTGYSLAGESFVYPTLAEVAVAALPVVSS